MKTKKHAPVISAEERKQRQKYLGATVITCIAVAMVFGTFHVVKLGANRMDDMRDRATYDLADMHEHVRAAGEDIILHRLHEEQKKADRTYALSELEAMLPAQKWALLAEMVMIPAGPFKMGTDSKRSNEFNKPLHTVETKAFEIDKYPVTNVEYAKFVMATKHRPPLDWDNGAIPDGKLMHPVTMVSWYDAQAFCRWEGKRLPTEVEWEKAARGDDGRRWPWGNQMVPENLNTYYNIGSTTDVTRYAGSVSPYGVFDMAGNVSEWTASDFEPYEGSKAAKDIFRPKMAQTTSDKDEAMKVADLVEVKGVYKVRRGGSWKSDPFATASYHRNYSLPHYASDFFGFRCAQDVRPVQVEK